MSIAIPGMAVLGVVPGEERPAEGDGGGNVFEAPREREERAREASGHGTHVTRTPGYAEWREVAGRALADCRKVLDDPETFGRHLDRRPDAADEMRRLSARIESDLSADKAEIERRQQQQERQKAMARDMGGLEL